MIHTCCAVSQYQKEKSDTPSNFTLKLRKHLRTRRLEDVKQLGVDRIVDFVFGTGEATHHLILELYSQVNKYVFLDVANFAGANALQACLARLREEAVCTSKHGNQAIQRMCHRRPVVTCGMVGVRTVIHGQLQSWARSLQWLLTGHICTVVVYPQLKTGSWQVLRHAASSALPLPWRCSVIVFHHHQALRMFPSISSYSV